MKSTSLIFAAAAFCSLISAEAFAEENYSLWPRRPAELEQARALVREQKNDEAVALLRPFVAERGVAGREARQIASAVNVRRYLSRQHPHAAIHVVKRGETMEKVASACRCPSDLIMLLNGMVEPSALKIGQKLVVVNMALRAEIHPEQREVSVWDGQELVADYEILSVAGLSGKTNTETTLSAREGTLHGGAVARRSPDYPASDRLLRLANGWILAGEQQVHGAVLRMRQQELNELILLLGVGAPISLVMYEENFTPPQPPPPAVESSQPASEATPSTGDAEAEKSPH